MSNADNLHYFEGIGLGKCPIWERVIENTDELIATNDGYRIYSSRADGWYEIVHSAVQILRLRDSKFKARLTSWLIDNRKNNECPKITTEIIELLDERSSLPIGVRCKRLLSFIGSRTTEVGSYLDFGEQKNVESAMAWSESTTDEELEICLNYLVDQGWCETSEFRIYGRKFGEYRLTVNGIAKIEDINENKSQAFVAMWFHSSMEEVREQGFRRAVELVGYTPILIDEKEHINKIDDEIFSEIRRSRFLIADFTHGEDGARGGVYYEAGFAHELDIPVIFTCRRDRVKDLHFDTRQFNHIVWDTPEDLQENLVKRIKAVIDDGPLNSTN